MRFNHGFILGKFYPPHKGHLHLINESKKLCNRLTVAISSLRSELIPGELRYLWLKDLVKNENIEIKWIQDENPQFPEEDIHFWDIWRSSILQSLDAPIDVLFSSENYGEKLSEVLGVKHRCIDLERNQVPISATQIRNHPTKYWEYIPEKIRPYFLKRIVLTGPESTGKSTLSKILASHFETEFVPEFARTYLDKMGRYVIKDDILQIGIGHLESELEKATKANRILFLDTDHLTTLIYSNFYFKSCPDWVIKRAKGLKYDVSLFMDIDIPWVADPQRELENSRDEMKEIFTHEMEKVAREFHMISGTFAERENQAIEIVNQVLNQPMNVCYFTEEQRNLRNI
ncbi:MAG: AAA family ATPase [Leptospira sp.]|nr:AAA family ATPase [Leptospira sp.]